MKKMTLESLVVMVLLHVFVSCSVQEKKEQSKQIADKQRNELPNMVIRVLDGTTLALNKPVGKSLVLVLFQPDCDHCQNEAREIKKNISAFRPYEVYFISAANVSDVKKFSIDFGLSSETNFHFATVDVQSIIDSYGQIPAPSIYIYSDEGKLRSQFNGETKIESVLKSI